jgi:hypothetical protein
LLPHDIRRAASLAACTAGNSNPTITPMIAITTNNSTNVNPPARFRPLTKLPPCLSNVQLSTIS